ncbi:MAG: 2-C-methyl-D-erythritol 4-phosphate cytidylyltransferase [Promethearchaeota archaeon]
MLKVYTIILAGGIGERIKHHLAKQFIKIAGKTVLEHTIDIFEKNDRIDYLIIVIHQNYKDLMEEIIIKNNYKKVIKILNGGETRQESSYIGLNSIEDEDAIVLIHDAVRPFISNRIINECIEALRDFNAVDVAIPSSDTIIEINNKKLITNIPNRKYLWRGQTPQGFKLQTIKKAHKLALEDNKKDTFSDDCGLVLEYLHEKIYVVNGEQKNIKITYSEDVFLADKLFQLNAFEIYDEISLHKLKQKVIVIFGGTKGIGKAISDIAKKYGAKVYNFSRSKGVDISNYEQIKMVLAETYNKESIINYIINTAGILRMGKLEDRDLLDDIFDEIKVNYFGSIAVCKAGIQYLKKSNGGILLFTSSSYTRGRALYSIYSSSKAAIVNLVQALSDELAIYNIKINAINPERTATPMRFKHFGKEPPETLLSPEQVAFVSLQTLLSNLTGSVIDVRRDDKELYFD